LLTISFRDQVFYLQVKAPVLIHTRVKIADYQYGQVVPLQATGQKPPVLNNVKLDIDELDQNRQKPKSFFERYVSIDRE
jgi:hypothetical protein